MKFDSRGEYEYYMASILPGLQSGEIVKVAGTRKICVVAREGILRHKAPGGATLHRIFWWSAQTEAWRP